ncbi:MAG: hypothetical protein ACREDL_00290 [Bradyrhizobium sp.]
MASSSANAQVATRHKDVLARTWFMVISSVVAVWSTLISGSSRSGGSIVSKNVGEDPD